jgi:lysosomal alpha-mannosidase
MLHRRLLVDDHFGVGEALNETAFDKGLVARGKHYLLFDFNPEEAFRRTRLLANELYAQPLVTFDIDEQLKKGTSLSPTTTNEMIELPPNVNLLTLEPISRPNENLFTTNLYLVRFEHLFDVDEHPDLSSPVKIPFKAFIEGYFDKEIKTVRETTLGGDRFKEDALNQKFQWMPNNNNECDKPHLCTSKETSKLTKDGFDEIELQPMEIRTFQVELM